MKRFLLAASLLLSVGSSPAFAQLESNDTRVDAPGPYLQNGPTRDLRNDYGLRPYNTMFKVRSLLFEAGLDMRYDSNILKLSADDIEAFESGGSDNRFSRNGSHRFEINSTSDYVLSPQLGAAWRFHLFDKFISSLRAGYHVDAYLNNAIATRQTVFAELRQELWQDNYLQAEVGYIPHVYERRLPEEDRGSQPARFIQFRRSFYQLFYAGGMLEQRYIDRRLALELGYRYGSHDYNSLFPERDSHVHEGRLGMTIRPGRKLESIAIEIDYKHRQRLALGDLEDTTAVEDDLSTLTNEWRLGLSGTAWGRKERSLLLSAGFGQALTSFMSDNPLDRTHHERFDRLAAIDAGIGFQMNELFDVASTVYYERNTTSLSDDAVDSTYDQSAYDRTRIVFSLRYRPQTGSILR